MNKSVGRELARAACALMATVGLAALTPAAQARTADFTLEQVLSAPFPSSLVTAPTGEKAAWVFNADGVRNVWVYEPGKGSRAITSYAGDDGSDMGELAWDPSGRQVLYIRGGSLEGGGPVNIMSRPDGAPPQEIWAAQVDGGPPRLVGPGHTPVVSPKGDRVAYVLGGQIWSAPLSGDGKPAPLISDRGRPGATVWSPDGSKLAFVSQRGDHALIGVYDFKAKAIRWLAPSTDMDMEPAWSPDGSRVAFVRMPTGAESVFPGHPEGQPWSIVVADAASGAGHVAWTADNGAGSRFNPLKSGLNLYWTSGDRLLFPWEKTGWQQLYTVSAKGGAAKAVTSGAFEVMALTQTPDLSGVVYASNEGDIDHRHLWQVSLDGGAAKLLTSGKTIEDYPTMAASGRLFALHGDARIPIRPVSVDKAGKMADLAPGATPASFPASKLVEPQQVVFTSPDGVQVHGQLFVPPAGKAGRGPALLFFHGGPTRQMLLGWHPMDAYAFMYGMNQYLANEGYVVLSVNYRGGIGYGLNFREAANFGPGGSSEFNDILGAAKYLRERPDVDAKRIGVWGGSYGGLMTALALSRASDQLAAGVDYAGVHDWKGLLPPTATPEVAKLAWDSSAMATIEKWRSPVLLVHADDDRNVPFAQTTEVIQPLRKQGVEVEQVVIPDEIHDLLRHQSWLTFFGAADDFFQRRLMGAKP